MTDHPSHGIWGFVVAFFSWVLSLFTAHPISWWASLVCILAGLASICSVVKHWNDRK